MYTTTTMSMTPTLIIVIAGAVLLGLAGIEYVQFRGRLERAKELIAKTVPFTTAPDKPTMRILVAGDSTAVGVGASTPAGSTAGQLGALFPQAAVVNAGQSGLRVAELAAQLRQYQGKHFDLVVLQIGGNDITHFTNLKAMESDINAALKQAMQLSPRVLLFTSGDVGAAPIFPKPMQLLLTRKTKQVREMFMQQASQAGATYVDLFEPRESDPFAKDPKTYYAADDFHPSSAGYAHWFNKIGPAAQTLLQ